MLDPWAESAMTLGARFDPLLESMARTQTGPSLTAGSCFCRKWSCFACFFFTVPEDLRMIRDTKRGVEFYLRYS